MFQAAYLTSVTEVLPLSLLLSPTYLRHNKAVCAFTTYSLHLHKKIISYSQHAYLQLRQKHVRSAATISSEPAPPRADSRKKKSKYAARQNKTLGRRSIPPTSQPQVIRCKFVNDHPDLSYDARIKGLVQKWVKEWELYAFISFQVCCKDGGRAHPNQICSGWERLEQHRHRLGRRDQLRRKDDVDAEPHSQHAFRGFLALIPM